MATLRPFRQIHENDVVNLFALVVPEGMSSVVKGALVKLDVPTNNGWVSDLDPLLSSINNGLRNTISDHWKINSNVLVCGAGEDVFGMLLHDVTDVDENNEPLLHHPRKAHEMQISLPGHPVPVLTRGIVMVNGLVHSTGGKLAAGPGVKVFSDSLGGMTTHVLNDMAAGYVGVCLGKADLHGNVLIKFEPRTA